MSPKKHDLTKLNVTAGFVSPNCASRAPIQAPTTALAFEKFSGSGGEGGGERRSEAEEHQAKRGREQAEGAAAKRSAGTERAAGRSLVTGLSGVDFVIPYPPSANNYWRTTRQGRTYVTHEARDYKATVSSILQGLPPTDVDLSVRIHVYRPAKRGDLDNCLKVLLDALKGFVFVDDDQVTHLEAWRHDDKHNPRAEVTVEAR